MWKASHRCAYDGEYRGGHDQQQPNHQENAGRSHSDAQFILAAACDDGYSMLPLLRRLATRDAKSMQVARTFYTPKCRYRSSGATNPTSAENAS